MIFLLIKSFFMCDKHRDQLIQPFGVLVVKPFQCRTIDVEHAEHSFAVEKRNDNLGVRSDITSYVSRKLMYIRHDDSFTLLRGKSTNATTKWNAHTGGFSLKWTKHQLFILEEIKACPIDVGK